MDYAQIGKVLCKGKPLAALHNGKWACFLSKRQFDSEQKLRTHIEKSSLYKEALHAQLKAGTLTLKAS